MPEWRTFSTDGSAEERGNGAGGDPERGSRWPGGRATVIAAGLTVVGGTFIGAALVALVGLLLVGPAGRSEPIAVGEPIGAADARQPLEATSERSASDPVVLIDVAGAVQDPGLHRLRADARVGDAIAAAGGYGPRVDLDAVARSLNLAQPLEDGAKVLVPQLGTGDSGALGGDGDDRVDLARASQGELERLPGVGPVTARKIIDARSEQRFRDVRDLRDRGLVGPSVFDDIKGLVRVGS